jgi:predicted site-specific integrase-resolvase
MSVKVERVLGSLPQRFIRAKELAAWLDISPPTLRSWVRQGLLPPPAIRTSKTAVWDLVAVEAHLARQQAEGGAHA